jgi:glycosyltransferase involved in cell wall biosynthesis
MRDDPFFSVVMATYGRGDYIAPSVESVLRQTFPSLELIVVGDGCDDNTEEVVGSFNSDRISWRNLAHNSGSQSFPNNEGIRNARGQWICYMGHDDLWSPDHLAQLHALIQRDPSTDFVVSGSICYGPPGSEVFYVTGLFDDSRAAFEHFFPPSTFAHRCDVPARIGAWRNPREISAPVDCEFLLRAAHAGLRFASTGQVTVHKFAAGHRYLSYLRPTVEEQRAVLQTFGNETANHTARLVECSRKSGNYMVMRYGDFSKFDKGELFGAMRSTKGLNRPLLQALTGRVLIEQTDGPRGLDWHGLEKKFRWSGPNPRPKILIPFTGSRADVALELFGMAPQGTPDEISVLVERRKVDHTVTRLWLRKRWLRFIAPLNQQDYTVVTVHTPNMFRPSEITTSPDRRRLGVAVGNIILKPLH